MKGIAFNGKEVRPAPDCRGLLGKQGERLFRERCAGIAKRGRCSREPRIHRLIQTLRQGLRDAQSQSRERNRLRGSKILP